MKNALWAVGLLCLSSFAQVDEKTASPAVSSLGKGPASPVATPPPGRRVMILVTATEHSGNPVSQLADKDLSVQDNERTGEVVDVRPANQLPLRVAFVLLAAKTSFGQQQAAAIELAHKILRPNIDRAFVLTARRG